MIDYVGLTFARLLVAGAVKIGSAEASGETPRGSFFGILIDE